MKRVYLCYARGCGCLIPNTKEAITAHFIEAHGWTKAECRDFLTDHSCIPQEVA